MPMHTHRVPSAPPSPVRASVRFASHLGRWSVRREQCHGAPWLQRRCGSPSAGPECSAQVSDEGKHSEGGRGRSSFSKFGGAKTRSLLVATSKHFDMSGLELKKMKVSEGRVVVGVAGVLEELEAAASSNEAL